MSTRIQIVQRECVSFFINSMNNSINALNITRHRTIKKNSALICLKWLYYIVWTRKIQIYWLSSIKTVRPTASVKCGNNRGSSDQQRELNWPWYCRRSSPRPHRKIPRDGIRAITVRMSHYCLYYHYCCGHQGMNGEEFVQYFISTYFLSPKIGLNKIQVGSSVI